MKRTAFLLLFLCMPAFVYGFQQVDFVTELGQEGSGPGQMSEPSDIAVDTDGTIFVAEKENRRIHVMNRGGRTITTWSGGKGDRGRLEEPSGIALYENKAYVTDSSRNTVLIFSKDGNFIDEFGEGGSDAKDFDDPQGICVHQGIVYVADKGNDRVQTFSLDGIYIGSIGKEGKGRGEMRGPTDVAVDNKGNIYVSEEGNNRVQAFTPSRKFRKHYYDVSRPSSIAVDDKGFFVADAGNYKVKRFAYDGSLLISFGTKGDGPSRFKALSGVSVDDNGKVFVIDSRKNTVQIFSPEKAVARITEPSPPPESVKLVRDMKIDAVDMVWHEGALYATSKKEDAVLVIQKGGVSKVIKGEGDFGLNDPHGIAVDSDGYIWVVDSGNNRIVKFSREGKGLAVVGRSGGKEGRFSSPKGVTIFKDIIYVADSGNRRIQFFNAGGVYMGKIERFGTKKQYRFYNPVDVGLKSSGDIYVVDEFAEKIIRFTKEGNFLEFIGKKGHDDGEFDGPRSILLAKDEMFVLDAENNRIQIFDHDGKFLRAFGAEGDGKGDFNNPSSIALRDENGIFVADGGNGRIQEFRIMYTPSMPLRLRAEGGPGGVRLAWANNPESYISHYRVYRATDNMKFKPVASPPKNSFTDTDIESGTVYFYRVSAVAKYGNEGAKTSPKKAVSQKPASKAPTDLKATPGENTITLSWKAPTGGASVSYFAVYRKKDGTFKRIGRAKTVSYTDKWVRPNKAYSYMVTAVGTDHRESEGAFVEVSSKYPITISVLKMRDIVPRAYKMYERDGIGTIRLTNNTGRTLTNVGVALTIHEFMDKPAQEEIRALPPGNGIDVDIKPVFFNYKIIALKGDTVASAKITADVFTGGTAKRYAKPQKVKIILSARNYTEREKSLFHEAMRSLDAKAANVSKALTVRKIREKLGGSDYTIDRLKKGGLSYGEIAVCLYISNATERPPMDLYSAKELGQPWVNIMGIFDLSIADITDTLKGLEKSLVIKKKPRRRRRETDRYINR